MTKDEKRIFTQRITSSNRTGIIVVLFDIYDVYIRDAINAYKEKDYDSFKRNVKLAQEVIVHLKNDLDFKYDISKNLYSLYDYSLRSLSSSIYRLSLEDLSEATKIMKDLKEAFEEVSKQDSSKIIMQNAEKVIYGMTYGKNDINENTVTSGSSRGFLA
jgi:flagellar protein FliS